MTQAILAGFLIGIGDIALMTITNQYIAAFLFCVALECVIFFGLPLYTGRIGKAPWERNWLGYLLGLLFNIAGSALAVWMFTLLNPDSKKIVTAVANTKFNQSFLVLFIAGIFCNVLIHLACSTKHTIIVIMCVMTFILCGFRHSIADAPYAFLYPNADKLIGWLAVLLGNTVGAIVTEWMLVFFKVDTEIALNDVTSIINEEISQEGDNND